jgi:hypothetical protein
MKTLLTSIIALAAMAGIAAAAQVGLKWNPNPETDIANYRVSWGIVPGEHTQSLDAGNNVRATVPNLVPGTKYYFVVQAINAEGLESEKSDEVSYVVPKPPAKPTGLEVVVIEGSADNLTDWKPIAWVPLKTEDRTRFLRAGIVTMEKMPGEE